MPYKVKENVCVCIYIYSSRKIWQLVVNYRLVGARPMRCVFFLSPSFKIFTVFKNDFRAYAVGSNAHRTVHRVPASGK